MIIPSGGAMMTGKIPRILFATVILLLPSASVLLPAQDEYIDVRGAGAAGDGTTDDTAAFLTAVHRGREEGRQVFVPRGKYVISEPINLENIGVTGPAVGAWPADINALPSILPAHRDGPAFRLGAGGSLRGLDITYQWDEEPEHGPPAVLIEGIGAYVSNTRIRYAWDGIVTDGDNNVGRLNIENVFMVAIRNTGVRVTGTWDVPRLNNIEVWNAGPVKNGMEKGIGFHLGKNDLIRITDCFVFAMKHGFLLEDRIEGSSIEGGTWGVMNGCSTDYCPIGIEVRGEHTLSVSGGTFWEHQESLIVDGKKARVRVSGAELKSNGDPVVVVKDADHVVISGCSLLRMMEDFGAPAVVLDGGRTTLTGNHIESYGRGVVINEGVGGAVISGNTIDARGKDPVDLNTKPGSPVRVGGNLELRKE
jgi:hypothetical protein